MTTPLPNETTRRRQLLEQRLTMIENMIMDLGYASEQEQEIARVLKLDRSAQLEVFATQTREMLIAQAFVGRKLAELPGDTPPA